MHRSFCPGLAIAALAAACVSVAALAQPSRTGSAGGTTMPATAKETMEAIEDKIDVLSKQLDKPEALDTIWEIERLALHAKSLTPEHLKGGATPENLTGFRKAQIELMKLLLQEESSILDHKTDEARKTLDAIDELRQSSHRKYKGKSDK
jgi:soluble cytochrome b562